MEGKCEDCKFFSINENAGLYNGNHLRECIHENNLKQEYDIDSGIFTETMNEPEEINTNGGCTWYIKELSLLEELKMIYRDFINGF